jgi:hypothetical protein
VIRRHGTRQDFLASSVQGQPLLGPDGAVRFSRDVAPHLAAFRPALRPDIMSEMIRHTSDSDLERYCLGMIQEGPELDALEEHLLICGECVDRAKASDAYIEGIRAALVKGGFGSRSLCSGRAAR